MSDNIMLANINNATNQDNIHIIFEINSFRLIDFIVSFSRRILENFHMIIPMIIKIISSITNNFQFILKKGILIIILFKTNMSIYKGEVFI